MLVGLAHMVRHRLGLAQMVHQRLSAKLFDKLVRSFLQGAVALRLLRQGDVDAMMGEIAQWSVVSACGWLLLVVLFYAGFVIVVVGAVVGMVIVCGVILSVLLLPLHFIECSPCGIKDGYYVWGPSSFCPREKFSGSYLDFLEHG